MASDEWRKVIPWDITVYWDGGHMSFVRNTFESDPDIKPDEFYNEDFKFFGGDGTGTIVTIPANEIKRVTVERSVINGE